MLLEVTTNEYKEFYKEVERHKYILNESHRFDFISINENIKDDETNNIRGIDILKDENTDVDFKVLKELEIEELENALLKLNDEEYKLIRAIFFEEKTIREYAQMIGKPFTTVQNRKINILRKLKRFLKIS